MNSLSTRGLGVHNAVNAWHWSDDRPALASGPNQKLPNWSQSYAELTRGLRGAYADKPVTRASFLKGFEPQAKLHHFCSLNASHLGLPDNLSKRCMVRIGCWGPGLSLLHQAIPFRHKFRSRTALRKARPWKVIKKAYAEGLRRPYAALRQKWFEADWKNCQTLNLLTPCLTRTLRGPSLSLRGWKWPKIFPDSLMQTLNDP